MTMMNLKIVKNSIADCLLRNADLRVPRTPEELVEDIYWIVAVESWERKIGDNLYLEDLTDAEYRLVVEWYLHNRDQYANMDKINFIRDLRSMFPGLALRAVYNLIKFKEREW